MSAENNYEEILEEVCEKINSLESIKEIDILDIKESLDSIEVIMTDTQAKLNFEEIKEKLENIAGQVDSCNESLLKDLLTDVNALKESASSVEQYIENLQNVQNLALTSAEFEEYQKQQLDLALKTNENIFNHLAEMKENASVGGDNSEALKKLETQLENLHKNLSSYIEQMSSKIENVPSLENIGAIMSDLNSVQHKSIKQTNVLLKDLQTRFKAFEENQTNSELENQLARLAEIYDSLSIIRAWIERVGYINQSIENVYARLGESVDFDDVAEKVDIIYENIGALNNWTMKIDNVDNSMSDLQSKLSTLSAFIEDTKNINETIVAVKEKLNSTFADELDFVDVTNKMDIIYENLSAINEWASKVDTINEQVTAIADTASKVDAINEQVSNLNSTINVAFEEDMIASKIDLVYENIGLLNEWVSKIDSVAQHSEDLDFKINELTETLSNAGRLIEDVPNIKDKLENLSSELHTIAHSTRNDADSYIYTLLDIESDFLKLHQFVNDKTDNLQKVLDDKTAITTNDINSLKEKFEELNNDLSSISVRTNKLILSADDANKEFKTHLEIFKSIINALEVQKNEFNPELKYALLSDKIAEMHNLMQGSLAANKNLNNAFMFLAEWVDATGHILNTMTNDIAIIKNKEIPQPVIASSVDSEDINLLKEGIANTINKINALEELVSSSQNNNEDSAEIKSLLSGVLVQLNTILPDSSKMEELSEKIDSLAVHSEGKFTQLEALMSEKINEQTAQIVSLEQKVDGLNNKFEDLNNKFDKLAAAMLEGNDNFEQIKEILKYIATQATGANETLAKSRVEEVADKLTSFDENINKIVSYIEEE